jgi:hypothetical protein
VPKVGAIYSTTQKPLSGDVKKMLKMAEFLKENEV